MSSSHARKRVIGPLVALALALALPGATFATTATSAVDESVTVLGTISMTGVPASLTYSSGGPGDLVSAPTFTATISTNNPTGAKFTWEAGPLTSGTATITPDQRRIKVGTAADVAYPGSGQQQLANTTSASTDAYAVTLKILIPNVPPGVYANPGSVTFRAISNP
jgi:hypothetical protein